MSRLVRIATRQSLLALWQAEFVADALRSAHPGIEIELVKMVSRGDKILDAPLAKIGGKGLFVKELEEGLLNGTADIAVHSMKDVPMEFPAGLCLAVVCEREDPRDAFVSNRYASLDALPQGARVGTSSLRRQCQVLMRRPDLEITFLRGNVQTRLAKLDAGDYDAIILASAGLKRLGLADRITALLEPELSLPAVGQGAVGVECRCDDGEMRALLAPLNHPDTWTRVSAERAMNFRLQGGCQAPIAGYATLQEDMLRLRGLVAWPDGTRRVFVDRTAPRAQAEELGTAVADELLSGGAAAILKELYAQA